VVRQIGPHAVFSETDFTEDLQDLKVPVLIMHGDDDQIVPIADCALISAKLVKNATLEVYEGYPHGASSDKLNGERQRLRVDS
jgi:non-heme chloroperoxidase